MDAVLTWLGENLGLVIGVPAAGTIGLLVGNFFMKVVLPDWRKKIILMAARLLSNMFGISYKDGEDMVEALPFVKKFDEFTSQMDETIYLKLVEYKQKLASPVLTAVEKMPIQQLYDWLYAKVKEKLPEEIRNVLEMYDQIIAEQQG